MAVTLHSGSPERAGMSAALLARASERAAKSVTEGEASAITLLVARHGTVVLHEAFGRLTPEADAPTLTTGAIFPLMSIGKVITATAIMLLVEEGSVGLTRPVQEYIPEWAGDGKERVMVHHLLTHSSGLVDDDVVAWMDKNGDSVEIPPLPPNQHPRIHELLWRRMEAPLSKDPGVEMSYSGTGYALLAEIVRRRGGTNLGEFAGARIFEPLGMSDTFYVIPQSASDRYVHRPADFADAARLEDPYFLNTPAGSIGGHSTAWDMGILCQTFLNGGSYGDHRLLSRAGVTEMTRNQIPGLGYFFKEDREREASRGYGWDVKGQKKPRFHGSLDSPAAYTHQGAGGTSIMVDPAYDLVVVYLSAARGLMSPDIYTPGWSMDLFTNMVVASITD
ncbi:MAG TPA: serine hydrolase domain-containing protein [Acidimicrobiales bacterium]|nr:serine hydrolase domain-containing protein [Acidimicrobiales bacterium]